MMAGRPGPRHKGKTSDVFDTFIQASSGGHKDWAAATDGDIFDWCCVRESQGNGTTWVHDPSSPSVGLTHGDACPPGSGCAKRYAARSIDTGLVSKLRVAFRQQFSKGEEWDPEWKKGNPCSGVLADSYVKFVTEKQKTAGVLVQRVASMLAHILAQLLRDMRERAQLEASVSERIAITRDIALHLLAMRRGLDLSAPTSARVGRADF